MRVCSLHVKYFTIFLPMKDWKFKNRDKPQTLNPPTRNPLTPPPPTLQNTY